VAFFSGCDLLPSLAGCHARNAGEYLYLTPPDAIAPPYNSPSAIKEILAHELSHLLHFDRKVLRNHLVGWPDGTYFTEGVGALAQDVIGYQAGNLYVTRAGLDGMNGFSLADVFDARERDGAPKGVLRGAAYLFVRYVYDRAGGDATSGLHIEDRGGPRWLRALLSAKQPTLAALLDFSRSKPEDIAMDFFTALAMSNRDEVGSSPPQNPCFAFLPSARDPITDRQRGADLFASFHGQRMNGPPIRNLVAPADAGPRQSTKLRSGGVAFVQVAAMPGTPALGLALQIDPRARPRVRVGRWE
jgi:hypothetical protein